MKGTFRVWAVLALSMVLSAACGEGSEVAQPSPTATPGDCVDLAGSVAATVRLTDFEFSPGCLVMSSSAGLSLRNDGSVTHNFTIAGTQVDLDTPAEAETNTEALGGVVEAGTHRFFCKYHEDQGMEGEVRVVV